MNQKHSFYMYLLLIGTILSLTGCSKANTITSNSNTWENTVGTLSEEVVVYSKEDEASTWREHSNLDNIEVADDKVLGLEFEKKDESIEDSNDNQLSKELEISSVTLLAVGDNLIHDQVIASGKKEDGSYNYNHLFSVLQEDIMAADIAIINQETILGGDQFAYTGYPAFNSPTEIGESIVHAGFDVVLHATNHTMDKGYNAVSNTFDFWDNHPHIRVIGINKTKEAKDMIPIIEKNKIRIAMLNYTYGLNGYSMPKDVPYLVNMLDKAQIKEDIKKAKEISDFVVVFPHWGTEYVYSPDKMQKEWTDFFAEEEVDLVIGTHPHVLQPVEWITTDTGHSMLIYYSLGNYVSYQKEAPRMLGGMAHITIAKDKVNTYISDASITPIVTHYENGDNNYNYGVYKLKDYTPEQTIIHGVKDLQKNSTFTYEGLHQLASKVLGDWIE